MDYVLKGCKRNCQKERHRWPRPTPEENQNHVLDTVVFFLNIIITRDWQSSSLGRVRILNVWTVEATQAFAMWELPDTRLESKLPWQTQGWLWPMGLQVLSLNCVDPYEGGHSVPSLTGHVISCVSKAHDSISFPPHPYIMTSAVLHPTVDVTVAMSSLGLLFLPRILLNNVGKSVTQGTT